MSRCVDRRVHGCSVVLFRAEFGPSYALAEAALAAQGEIEPPLEAYDEALQMASPNRHPIVSGVELDGALLGTFCCCCRCLFSRSERVAAYCALFLSCLKARNCAVASANWAAAVP